MAKKNNGALGVNGDCLPGATAQPSGDVVGKSPFKYGGGAGPDSGVDPLPSIERKKSMAVNDAPDNPKYKSQKDRSKTSYGSVGPF